MADKSREQSPDKAAQDNTELFDRIVAILEQARSHVVRTVNNAMVVSYWLIGREIVQEIQAGEERAEYGKQVIEDLSKRLNERYGKGYSASNLWYFRQFYLAYKHRIKIPHPLGGELEATQKPHPAGGELFEIGKGRPMDDEFNQAFSSRLSWSHYRALMRVDSKEARQFYEQEAVRNRWNKRQLERQINTLLFERLLKSRDKDGVLQLANEGMQPSRMSP